MTNLTSSDLSDPQPPLPGERERALVATRAHELGRRRRLLQGGGALALVAAVAVSVAALTAGGASGPGGTNRVEAASGTDTSVSTPVSHVTTVPSTVAPTTVPAPTAATEPAPQATPDTTATAHDAPVAAPQDVPPVQAEVPTTFTLSGTVTGNPADTTVSLLISGPGGDRTVNVDGAGNFSIGGLDAGDYQVIGQWTDSTNTATGAQKFGTVSITADSSSNFTFSN
jgi:hypothetical protein